MIGFSIVLCTHNGVLRLSETLQFLSILCKPGGYALELILVDNASTDGTAEFAELTWQALGNPYTLRIMPEPRPGKGYAVETGYDSANYKYILTVDDDNWLDINYLIKAVELFNRYSDIGVLQGHSTGKFEVAPPAWVKKHEQYFIIGGPTENVGYFSSQNFFVWGAGMVILKEDWNYLRSNGFSFLTSKLPGKAAGEDNETAIALLLLGRKIYYSDELKYIHFMPKGRVVWSKLMQNFEVFGYVSHYVFLYALVIDAYLNSYKITKAIAIKKFFIHPPNIFEFTWKQNILYWAKPLEEWYQLELNRRYSQYKWFFKLLNKIESDVEYIQKWIIPLLEKNRDAVKWHTHYFE